MTYPSTRLIRQSFIEFDLERMFDEDLFADFAVLFRLIQATERAASWLSKHFTYWWLEHAGHTRTLIDTDGL